MSDIAKPKLSIEACRLFYSICRYVRQYPSAIVRYVASDVMDGGYRNSDSVVQELKRKQIIRSVAGSWELTPCGREAVSRVPFVPEYQI